MCFPLTFDLFPISTIGSATYRPSCMRPHVLSTVIQPSRRSSRLRNSSLKSGYQSNSGYTAWCQNCVNRRTCVMSERWLWLPIPHLSLWFGTMFPWVQPENTVIVHLDQNQNRAPTSQSDWLVLRRVKIYQSYIIDAFQEGAEMWRKIITWRV